MYFKLHVWKWYELGDKSVASNSLTALKSQREREENQLSNLYGGTEFIDGITS